MSVAVSKPKELNESWIDRFFRWVENRAWPVWLTYLGLTLLLSLFMNALTWLDGRQDFPQLNLLVASDGFWSIFPLAFMHFVNHQAAIAFEEFRPLLEAKDAQRQHFKHRLSQVSGRSFFISLGIALTLFAIGFVLGDTTIIAGSSGQLGLTDSALVMTVSAILGPLTLALSFTMILHGINQLRVVSDLHRRATKVNLFQLDPTHAFSKLTARIGMGLVIMVVVAIIQNGLASVFALSFSGIVLLLAVITFTAPLSGMRAKLNAEKSRLLRESNARIEHLYQEINERADKRDYSLAGEQRTALQTLLLQREEIEKISTWPWEARTLRSFASTFLLPILLWFITRLLERFV